VDTLKGWVLLHRTTNRAVPEEKGRAISHNQQQCNLNSANSNYISNLRVIATPKSRRSHMGNAQVTEISYLKQLSENAREQGKLFQSILFATPPRSFFLSLLLRT